MTAKEQKKAAADFAAKWAGRGYEKGECQKFWRGLLHDVFGVSDPDDWVQYEVPVATGFVDACPLHRPLELSGVPGLRQACAGNEAGQGLAQRPTVDSGEEAKP